MFYVSRKVGRKYGVIDTSDNVEEFYSMKDLENFYNNGVAIKGVDYVGKRFVVTPAIFIKDKVAAAKNRIVKGTCTGYDGFDLKFEGDKVTAMPLSEEFFNKVKENSIRRGFVLTIPDMVTHLADNFFNPPNDFNTGVDYIRFSVVLPKTLVEIGSDALRHWYIDDITFNSTIDRIVKSNRGSSSLSLANKNLVNGIFHVRVLEKDSLFVSVTSSILSLPDIEWMDECSIDFNSYSQNLSVRLGNKIQKLRNFVKPLEIRTNSNFGPKASIAKQLMNRATIVYFDENCVFTDIDMTSKNEFYSFDDSIYASAYIFVMSSKVYNRLKNIIHQHELSSNVTIGVLTYDTDEGLSWLEENLAYCCQHHRQNFKTYLDENDLGSYKILELK